jgi:hypothetical protein
MVWVCIIYSVSTVLRVQYVIGSPSYKLPLYPEGGTQSLVLVYFELLLFSVQVSQITHNEQPTIAIQLQAKGQIL